MHKSFHLPFVAIVAVLSYLTVGASDAQAGNPGPVPRIESTQCRFEIPQGETIECGYLVVPEQRSRSDSRDIRVSITVIKSHSPNPAPDPILYLNGGPGGKSKEIIDTLRQYDAWLARRDLILFDQRGVGWSQPALDCPELKEIGLLEATGGTPAVEDRLAPALACRDCWLNQGIELTAYNSAETAADVADLWRTLGYDQVNLYGVSYGTLLAQLVMRDHNADGEIRSVVLDSSLPVSIPVTAETAATLSDSMRQLFDQCKADVLCRTVYPNLDAHYLEVIDRLNTSPVTLSGTNPLNDDPFSFQFDAADFGEMIMYGNYRAVPALIYDVYEGDYTAAIEARETLIRNTKRGGGDGFGLRTSIGCNEPWFTVSPAEQAAAAIYPEVVFVDNPLDAYLCRRWPPFSPIDQTPVVSDIPTLILMGEYDLRLPLAYAETIADSLSNGVTFLVPGVPHSVLKFGGSCPNLVMLSFLDNPTQRPDSDCLASAGSPRLDTQFIIRAAGVRLPVQALLGGLSVLLLGVMVGAGLQIRHQFSSGLRFGVAWCNTLRIIGWRWLIASAALIGFAFYASQIHLLPINLTDAIALVVPIIVAIQAAFLFSPEDEPALEVILAAPRPLVWTVLERLAILLILQGSLASVASLFLARAIEASLTVTIVRWLPVIFFLSGVAVYVALATRRAVLGILVVCLIWISDFLFGEFLIDRWPITWPFHLYLQPGHAEYTLNRLFIATLGVSLISMAAKRLLADTERLLLGRGKSRARPKANLRVMTGLGDVTGFTGTRFRSRMVFLTQLAAMIRYELLLQWRRVTLPALMVGLTTTPVLGAFIAQGDFRGYRHALAAGTLSLEVAKAEITGQLVLVAWLGAWLVCVAMVPLVAADSIPKDQQIGMRELLDSLPISPGTYLAGKLFSLWCALLVGLSLAALAAGAMWWLLIGPFELSVYLDLWFLGTLLLMFINAGTSMLLASGQPTNRRAILVGGAYAVLCLAGLGLAFAPAFGWLQWLNPARPSVVLYYLLGISGVIGGNDDLTRAALELVQQVASRRQVLRSLGAGLVQVGLVWLIVWQWLKRRRI